MKFLSKKAVCEKLSISRATVDRRKDDPTFPKRVPRGARVYWLENEVDDYMLALAASRDRSQQTSR